MWHLAIQTLKTYLNYQNAYGHLTWQGCDLLKGALTQKVTRSFDYAEFSK